MASDKTYCNPRKALITDLVTPTYEETRPVKGCVASVASNNDIKLVVIRAKKAKAKTEILLTLTDSNAGNDQGIVQVLDSSTPITWKLSFLPATGPRGNDNGTADKYQVVLSPGSTIFENKAEILPYKNLDPEMTDEKFGTLVEQNYGEKLSMLATVENANRISLSLSGSGSSVSNVPSSSSKCNLSTLGSIPDHAVAFRVEKQQMFGCYHAERAGSMATDLLVIDLKLEQHAGIEQNVNLQPVVFLSMTPIQHNDGSVIDPSPRNLTLVLNSNRPVRWYLESWKMIGTLQVISSNGLVENHALSPGQSLQIIRKRLEDNVVNYR